MNKKVVVGAVSLVIGLGLVAAWMASSPDLPTPEGKQRHVVLIVIDTLRDDVVREVPTPTFDAMAQRGQRVTKAWSPSTWTAPSMISVMTGTHVRESGWDFPFPNRMENRTDSYPAIPEQVPTLAQVLEGEGFSTDAIWGNPLLDRDLGLERGFDTWQPSRDRELKKRVAEQVAAWKPGERHFLYLHMFGGHHPLRPSAEAKKQYPVSKRWLRKGHGFNIKRARKVPGGAEAYATAYRGVVMDIDTRLGLVLEALGPHLEESVVVVTADHGELLGEHGKLGHERWLWEQLTNVPLYQQGGPQLPELFPLAGIADYLTDAVGIDHPWPVQWDAAGPLVAQREGKLAFSEDGRHKGIWDPEALGVANRVFDLVEDPLEAEPIAEGDVAMQRLLDAWQDAVPSNTLAPREGAMTDETMSALQALGYMDEDEEWDGEDAEEPSEGQEDEDPSDVDSP